MTSNSPASGCKYQFVSEPDAALKCLICLGLAEEPWQHEGCGKLFCRKCLERYGRTKPCSHCRSRHPKYFEDCKSKREIKALSMKCGFDGCSEVMELQNLQQHARVCEHALISCKYVYIGCKKELRRRDMAAHEEDREAHFQMALDTVHLLRERHWSGQPIKFKLTHFHTRKERDQYVQSPSHYIASKGYHMAVGVFANGYGAGKGTHLLVSVVILKGRYDAELKWPFAGEITLTLLNQLEDKNHHQRVLNLTAGDHALAGEAPWGYEDYIPHSKLGHDPVKNTQYLKDDTLYFRMEVEVADHKPWLE